MSDLYWLADRGYDAEWFRDALEQKGIKPCIPGRKSRSMPVQYDKRRHKRRNRIEITSGHLKDWRRVAIRYDRSPTGFFSALDCMMLGDLATGYMVISASPEVRERIRAAAIKFRISAS